MHTNDPTLISALLPVFLLVPSLLGSSALLPSGAGLKQAGQLLADLAADDVGRMAGEVAGSHLLEARDPE